YERALRVVLGDDGVDAVLALFVPPLVTEAEDVAHAIARAAGDAGDKPVVACFLGRAGVPNALRAHDTDVGRARTVPSFAFPEAAAQAMARAAALADWRARPVGNVPHFDDVDLDRARAHVDAKLASVPPGTDGMWLDPADAAALLACFNITVLQPEPVDS